MADAGPDRHAEQDDRRALALVEQAAGLLASARDVDDVYRQIVRAAALILSHSTVPWRAAYMVLEGDLLRTVAVHNEGDLQLHSREYPLKEYPALRHVVTECTPLYGSALALSRGVPQETRSAVERSGMASAAMFPVALDGTVAGVIGVSSLEPVDESEVPMQRLAAVARLAELAIRNVMLIAEHRAVADQARSLENAKSRFLNLAAHEMRGPVAVIRGYASMLRDGDLGRLTDEGLTAAARLSAKAEELHRLVELLLDAARIDQGSLDLAAVPVDLREVVEAALTSTAAGGGDDHDVHVDIACDRAFVLGDAAYLTAATVHLVENAQKYSPPGSPITVRCAVEDGLGVIEVRDRGIGLSDEDQAALFTRFGRVVSGVTSSIPGVGLGLWRAREIARLHGGDISVASRPGEGSTFRLAVPLVDLGLRAEPVLPPVEAARSLRAAGGGRSRGARSEPGRAAARGSGPKAAG